MKIVLVYGDFNVPGGIETYMLDLSRTFEKRGHVCFIATSRWIRRVLQISRSDYYVERFPLYLKQLLSYIRMLSLLRKSNPDVLHINGSTPFPFTLALTILGHIVAERVAVTPHANPQGIRSRVRRGALWQRPLLFIYFNGILRLVYKRADAIIALTRAEAEVYRKWGLVNVYTIPSTVNTEVFHPENDGKIFREMFSLGNRKIILTAGRLVPYKRFDILIQAAKIVEEEFPQAMFVIVGKGPERRRLESMVDSLGLSGSVLLTGYLSFKMLPLAYAAADVFVLPSHDEPFGKVLLEAMSTGKPTIASSGGGVSQVVNNSSTILLDECNPATLARAIIRILRNPHFADSLGKKGLELVKRKYSLTTVAKRVEAVYFDAARTIVK